jgi:hypothetical protein
VHLHIEEQSLAGSGLNPDGVENDPPHLPVVDLATDRQDLAVAIDFQAANLSASRGLNLIDDRSNRCAVVVNVGVGFHYRLLHRRRSADFELSAAVSEIRITANPSMAATVVKTRDGDRDGGPLLIRRENGTTRSLVRAIEQSSGSQSATSIGPNSGFRDMRLDFCLTRIPF